MTVYHNKITMKMAKFKYNPLLSIALHIWIIFLNVRYTNSYDCYGNDMRVGSTYPKGDIIVEYNKESLQIYCKIDNETYIRSARNPSRYLKFKVDNQILKSHIVNETTIRHFNPKPAKSNKFYMCYIHDLNCNEVIVGMNKVFVATPPAMSAVDLNFNCISLNNDNLTCTWNRPDNIISTDYSLHFKTTTNASRIYLCPRIEDNEDQQQASCFWSIHTPIPYRQSLPVYIFELHANNSLGMGSFTYTFDHFNNVRPNAPEDLTVVSTTTNSMLLQWRISDTMISFRKGLKFRVMYLCEYGPNVWNDDNIGYIQDMKIVKYNLTNLRLAHNLCDIRVSLTPNVTNFERMWSANATITARTASTIPGAPPKVNVGSFESGSDNEAYIYWQQVPEEKHNGENFRYNVQLTTGQPNVIIDDVKSTYAVIKNLLPNESYTFAISSVNNYGPNMSSIGISLESSFITIPAKKLRPSEPKMLTKMQYNNGSFSIFWHHHGLDESDVRRLNYTVFWCRAMKERPYKCSGYLDWVEVAYGTTNYTPQVEPEINNTVYQIAISANSIDTGFTSGMVWECCILAEGNIYKVHLDSAHPQGNSSIKLTWSQGCIDTTIKEFVISYCLVTDPKSNTCKEPRVETIVNGNLTEAIIRELKPYTTYLFWVAVRTNSGQRGKESEPIRVTNLEEAPSKPTDLKLTSVRNSSIVIKWKKPEFANGCINKYIIFYNQYSATSIIDCTSDSDVLTYTLDNLESFKSYEICVSACTNYCSPESNTIMVSTLIGYPGRIIQPTAPYINSSAITVTWSKPAEARGPINNYQVKIVKQRDGRQMEEQILNTTGTSYSITCDDSVKMQYGLSVRALNIADNKEYLYGPWSEDFVGNCSNSEQVLFWILVAALLCSLVVMMFVIKKFYLRIIGMKNVEMTLPVGLTNDFPIYNKTINDREVSKSAADEELLLKTRTESNKTPSGESSGCSSAHDSVVSDSVSANSNASSDSGTEQSELRRRQPAYVSMPAEIMTKPTPKIIPNLYSKVGLDPGLQSDPKITSIDATYTFDSTPYVQTVTSPTNKMGYVPIDGLMSLESDKTPPYVIAGTGTTTMSDVKPYVQVTDINLMKTASIPHKHCDSKFLKED